MARHTFDTETGGALCYHSKGMFDLDELPARGEDGERVAA